jgi:hypothetical protein
MLTIEGERWCAVPTARWRSLRTSPFVVGQIIDGRHILRGHGDSAMPVWGDAFRVVAGTGEEQSRARVDALVKHLEAMQQDNDRTPAPPKR